MSLATLQTEAIKTLRTALPGLVQCEPYAGQFDAEEARTINVNAPALFLYAGGGAIERHGGGILAVAATMTAYCVTKFNDSEARRNQSAMCLAERVAELVEGENFGLGCRATAAIVKEVANAHRLGLARAGLSAWYVTWEQNVVFGEKSWLTFEGERDLPHLPQEVWAVPSVNHQVDPARRVVSQE